MGIGAGVSFVDEPAELGPAGLAEGLGEVPKVAVRPAGPVEVQLG